MGFEFKVLSRGWDFVSTLTADWFCCGLYILSGIFVACLDGINSISNMLFGATKGIFISIGFLES